MSGRGLSALAVLLAAVGALAAASCARRDAVPSAGVGRARAALRRARVEAGGLAPAELSRAVSASARLERRLAEAGGGVSVAAARDVDRLAAEAESTAVAALVAARREGDRRRGELGARRADLARRLAALDGYVELAPADRRLRERAERARLDLDLAAGTLGPRPAAALAAAAAGLDDAGRELDVLEGLLGERYARLRDPRLLRLWQGWVDETVAESRGGGTAVVVDKLARRCVLLAGGRVAAVFAAELGRNGLAEKLYAGDEATPEGRYRVTEKRGEDATRYHRALVLDYPAPADVRRFGEARAEVRSPLAAAPAARSRSTGTGGGRSTGRTAASPSRMPR